MKSAEINVTSEDMENKSDEKLLNEFSHFDPFLQEAFNESEKVNEDTQDCITK